MSDLSVDTDAVAGEQAHWDRMSGALDDAGTRMRGALSAGQGSIGHAGLASTVEGFTSALGAVHVLGTRSLSSLGAVAATAAADYAAREQGLTDAMVSTEQTP